MMFLSHNIGRIQLHQANIGIGYGYNLVPLPLDDEERKWRNDADAWATDAETEYSALRLNIDLRLGIAYNWRNYFIGAQAQFNKFNYKKDLCRVNLYDAYARVALGIRLYRSVWRRCTACLSENP